MSSTASSAIPSTSTSLTPEESSSSSMFSIITGVISSTSSESSQSQYSSTAILSIPSTLSTITTTGSSNLTSTATPTATPSAALPEPTKSDGSLSTAMKAGIALAVIVFVIIILIGLLFLLRKLHQRKQRLAQQTGAGHDECSTEALSIAKEKSGPTVETRGVPAEETHDVVGASSANQGKTNVGGNQTEGSDANHGSESLSQRTS